MNDEAKENTVQCTGNTVRPAGVLGPELPEGNLSGGGGGGPPGGRRCGGKGNGGCRPGGPGV